MSEKNALPIRLVDINRLGRDGERFELVADKDGLQNLAKDMGVLRLKTCSGNLLARPWSAQGMRLEGQVHATLEQACTITMEPVEEIIEVELDRHFLPKEQGRKYQPSIIDGEMLLDPEDDPPDLIEGTRVDLWEVVLEELNLAINLFPRAPESDFDRRFEGDEEPSEPNRPFAGLEALLKQKKS